MGEELLLKLDGVVRGGDIIVVERSSYYDLGIYDKFYIEEDGKFLEMTTCNPNWPNAVGYILFYKTNKSYVVRHTIEGKHIYNKYISLEQLLEKIASATKKMMAMFVPRSEIEMTYNHPKTFVNGKDVIVLYSNKHRATMADKRQIDTSVVFETGIKFAWITKIFGDKLYYKIIGDDKEYIGTC